MKIRRTPLLEARSSGFPLRTDAATVRLGHDGVTRSADERSRRKYSRPRVGYGGRSQTAGSSLSPPMLRNHQSSSSSRICRCCNRCSPVGPQRSQLSLVSSVFNKPMSTSTSTLFTTLVSTTDHEDDSRNDRTAENSIHSVLNGESVVALPSSVASRRRCRPQQSQPRQPALSQRKSPRISPLPHLLFCAMLFVGSTQLERAQAKDQDLIGHQ